MYRAQEGAGKKNKIKEKELTVGTLKPTYIKYARSTHLTLYNNH